MPATNITSAGLPRSADRDMRERRYLITMAFRVACFIGAYFAPGPWRWILLIGAAILPGIAVVLANAVDERRIAQSLPESPQRGLAAAPQDSPSHDPADQDPIPGELLREGRGNEDDRRVEDRRTGDNFSGATAAGTDSKEGPNGSEQSR